MLVYRIWYYPQLQASAGSWNIFLMDKKDYCIFTFNQPDPGPTLPLFIPQVCGIYVPLSQLCFVCVCLFSNRFFSYGGL